MKNKILLLVSCLFLFFSCKKEIQGEEVMKDSIADDTLDAISKPDMHNSEISLDWQGTYKGILPCASCEGIETEITLNNDLTFLIKTNYLGKGRQESFEQKGSFDWDESGSIIILQDLKSKPNQYKVGENTLTQLDLEGNRITGELADKYVLHMQLK
jgi:uncharacterized lipoprotein NlpE involved in copper resistance